MRGPQVKTPLLFLLLLVTSLSGTAFCQDYDTDQPEADAEPEAEPEADAEAEPEPEAEAAEDGAEQETEPVPNEETDAGTEITVFPSLEPSPTEDSSSEPVEGSTPHDSGETRRMDPGISDYVPDTSFMTTEHQSTESPQTDEELSLITILIPVVLAVLIAGMIVFGIFISRHWKKKVKYPEQSNEDPYLEGSSTEKVPMPMFEEDVPSVLELEMEELDQWMKKDY